MALIVADRVQETSTTTGTGAYTLLGATTANRAASTVCANGDTLTYYAEAIDVNERPTGDWETGLGTWGTGNILTRTTIYASSNAGAAVSWGAGTKRIGLGLVANAALGPTTVVGNITATNLSGTNTGDNATNTNYASDYRVANFVAGTDYLTPTGSAASLTSFPTLNQNTTGSAGLTVAAATFTTTGGAAAGTTFNGSTARTIDYTTVGAAASGHNHSGVYQPVDADLTAIAALVGTSGLLKKTATDTWTLDTAAYTTNTGTVTSVAALTLGTTGTDVSSSVATGTTTPVITLNIPTASAANRGALSAADWTTFNGKTSNTGTVTSVGGTGTVSGLSLSGTVTTTGNLTLGGTLAVTASNFASQTANTALIAPNGSAGVPTFRVLTLEDLPDAWVKKSVTVATTAAITLSGTQTIDGIAVVATDRVLVKNQGTPATNGIYVVAAGAWTRALDSNTIDKVAGSHVNVDKGTTNGGLSFDNDLKTTDTLGTTAMVWSRIVDTAYTIPTTQGGTGATDTSTALTNLGAYPSSNPSGYTNNAGTVTSVIAGNGMTQTGTSTVNPTLNIVSHAGTAGTIGTINVGADAIGVNLGTTSTTAYPGNNPSGFTTNTGTVTSVAALTLGTTGTDVSSSVATGTTTPVITLNIPTASAANRGALSAADWTTFNGKGNMVLATVQSVTGLKTFDSSAIALKGSSTGTSTFASANASVTNYTITVPAVTGTLLTTGNVITVAQGGTGVATLTGIVKANGTSNFAAAVAGTDYLTPTGSAASLTSFPTLNQNTTGTSGGLTGTPNITVGTVSATTLTVSTSTTQGIIAPTSGGITFANSTDGAVYRPSADGSTYVHTFVNSSGSIRAGIKANGDFRITEDRAYTWITASNCYMNMAIASGAINVQGANYAVIGINNTAYVVCEANLFRANTDNSTTLGTSGNRWSTVYAATGTINTSDARLKTDIIESELGLAFISKLRPVSYKWIVGSKKIISLTEAEHENARLYGVDLNTKTIDIPGKRTHYGFLAQDVYTALNGRDFGGYVHDVETDTKSLRYDQFIAPMTKAIQELHAQLLALKADFEAYKVSHP